MKNRMFGVLMCSTLLLFGCGSDPLDVDASSVKVELDYLNLDSALYHTPNSQREDLLGILASDYSDIIDYQTAYCFRVGLNPVTSMESDLQEFYSNPYVERLEKQIGKKFNDLPKRHEAITDGFKHIKFHLPNAKLPSGVIFTNSYFASSAFCTEENICMGLERYLGERSPVIKELPSEQFPQYIKRAFNDNYLERDAVCAWILTHIVPEKEDAYTIEAIVNWGKVLYLTEAAFPDKEQHEILRYTQKELDWAMENERSFWEFLVKQKLLYSKDDTQKANFLNEAPFTAGLPKKGPDRLGQFLGWRIIHSYMEQYDVPLQKLMDTPYTTLLQEYEITD